MRKLVPIVASLIALLVPAAAAAGPHAQEKSFKVILAGDGEDNAIAITLSGDGRWYTIESSAPLEVGGEVCSHRDGRENVLQCQATAIAGFEVHGYGGDDVITLGAGVPVAATLRGGPGDDRLLGGSAGDRLLGGPGDDFLAGRAGDDALYGGPGDDRLLGGPGNDRLSGEAGTDRLRGGPGVDEILR